MSSLLTNKDDDDDVVLCSMIGSTYDFLSYVHPSLLVPHAGSVGFSTHDNDNDILWAVNCAMQYQCAWWFTKCFLFAPTLTNPGPIWFSKGDSGFHPMERVHMMLKLQ